MYLYSADTKVYARICIRDRINIHHKAGFCGGFLERSRLTWELLFSTLPVLLSPVNHATRSAETYIQKFHFDPDLGAKLLIRIGLHGFLPGKY